MASLDAGESAKIVLGPSDIYRVTTTGQATVTGLYGAPSTTTTVTAGTRDFGPYNVAASLRVTGVSGSTNVGTVEATPLAPTELTQVRSLVAGDGIVPTGRVDTAAPSPGIVAHRGGSYLGPENTLRAFDTAYGQGFRLIECDLRLMSGGGLALMHDATVDRTTDGTGNVSSFTAATIKSLTVDALTARAANHKADTVPTFAEALDWARTRDVVLVPELKDDCQYAALAELLQRDFPRGRVIFQTFTLAWASALAAAGYACLFASASLTTGNITAAAAAGFKHVATQDTVWTQSLVDAAHAAGLKCWAYTVSRRYQYDRMKALGVDFVYSDDPQYLLWGVTGFRPTRSLYDAGVWAPGMQSATTTDADAVRRGLLVAPYFQLDDQTGYTGTSIGHLGPLPDAWTMTGTVQFAAGATTWASLFLGATDRPYIDGSASAGGYHCLMRVSNGNVNIYKAVEDVSGATLLGTGNGSGAVTTGVDVAWSLSRTAAGQYTLQLGANTPLVLTDASITPRYLQLGRNAGSNVKFGPVAVA